MSIRVPESTLETFIAENLQSIFGDDATLIGRQVRLESGRIPDIVFTQRDTVVVVEVKARRIDRAAVCQLLEYMGEITAWAPRPKARLYRVSGVVAAPEVTRRAATMLQCLPDVRFLEMVPELTVRTELIDRCRAWACCEIDITHVEDILPDDSDISTAIRLATSRAEDRACRDFADWLLSSYLWFYEDGALYSDWRPHESMPRETAKSYVDAVERKLRLEYPGANTRLALPR